MWSHFSCGKISFVEICLVAIYAVFSQNLFCRDLLSMWRKKAQNVVRGEKMINILYENNCNSTLTPAQVFPEIETYVRFSRNAVLFQFGGQRGVLEIVFPIFKFDLWK